jgi:hypothetical protein
MAIVYTDKCWYEIQEQKEVSVWYTNIYQLILATEYHCRYLRLYHTASNDKLIMNWRGYIRKQSFLFTLYFNSCLEELGKTKNWDSQSSGP